ncbi:MAG: tRNA uridine-5-carboxymethylaminomethyl(34) synthesis GTPase MnmE [Bacteroidota bacterium]
MATTIVALATPPGIGGLAVIRISGEKSFEIVDRIFSGRTRAQDAGSHTIHYGKICRGDEIVDTVTVSVFRKPNSYTGEDVAEISCHGGMIVANEIIDLCIENGAEIAKPGEFTRRAFINGKLDLSQVEAVADIIHSTTRLAAQTASRQLVGNFKKRLDEIIQNLMNIAGLLELELDFVEEEIELVEKHQIIERIEQVVLYCSSLASSHRSAEILRNGFYVGIAGFPNSGKSTLFNTLLQKHRAIVSPIPGTTRDYIEESLYIGDIHVRLVDTAGVRSSDDIIEVEGIRLVENVLQMSDLILVINDATKGINHSDELAEGIRRKHPDREVVVVQNKVDLLEGDRIEGISAKHNLGIEKLKELIAGKAKVSFPREQDALINQRQAKLLAEAAGILQNSIESIKSGFDNVAIAIDIRQAAEKLGEITGKKWSEDVLNQIFSNFCIGK